MLYRRLTAILSLSLFFSVLNAETTVNLTIPTLKPGMAALEAMLALSVEDFNAEINDIITSSLDKPLFMEGFSGAAAMAVIVPGTVDEGKKASITIGSAGSVFSDNLSLATIDRIRALETDSDLKAGACIQPLVINVNYPLEFLYPGLSGGAALGFMNAETGKYGIWSFSAGLSARIHFFAPRRGYFSWDGVSVSGGTDYAVNRLTALIHTGEVSKNFDLDPDGLGPLVPINVTLSMNPSIRAGIESNLLSFKLQARTGVTCFDALSLFAGAGVSAAFVKTGISLDADEPITIRGYLANLVEKQGRISVTGTTAAHDSFSGGIFLLTGMKFSVGSFVVSIPLVWKPFESLGTGVFAGVHL